MKRLQSDPETLVSMCSSGEDRKEIYGRGLEIMMDGMEDDDCVGGHELGTAEVAAGGGGIGGEKKRRLSMEQVRSLEKNFEVENKLEPERKVRLAQELGLQPRQVAVWFQNRRARWKTKQLERDYATLKASYDALRLDYDSLHRDKESLLAEIRELKGQQTGEESLSFSPVKEELAASETEAKTAVAATSEEEPPPPPLIYKDGSSVDSDSSAVLNDEHINYGGPGMSSSTTAASAASFDGSAPFPAAAAAELLPFMFNSDANASKGVFVYQLKSEENEFLSEEEPCSRFFSDEQPPTLNWYCSEHWN